MHQHMAVTFTRSSSWRLLTHLGNGIEVAQSLLLLGGEAWHLRVPLRKLCTTVMCFAYQITIAG